jgi:hypothetical protein
MHYHVMEDKEAGGKRGWRRIPIREEVYLKLQAIHNNMDIDKSMSGWISDLLALYVMKHEFLNIFAPHLSYIATHNNELYLKDNKIDKIVELYIRDNKVYCKYCERDNCMHVMYAIALLEIGKLTKYLKKESNQ